MWFYPILKNIYWVFIILKYSFWSSSQGNSHFYMFWVRISEFMVYESKQLKLLIFLLFKGVIGCSFPQKLTKFMANSLSILQTFCILEIILLSQSVYSYGRYYLKFCVFVHNTLHSMYASFSTHNSHI